MVIEQQNFPLHTTEHEEIPAKPTKRYFIGWETDEPYQACHGRTVEIEEGADLWETALNFVKTVESCPFIIDAIEELQPGKKASNF